MRVCAIDVGTNTVNSLVADATEAGLVVLADEERFARLGQGVDAAGCLAPEAMDRVVDRLAAAKATADRLGAERIVIGATSASRDAANIGDLQTRVRHELGLEYRVISGDEEARLSFLGSLALLPEIDGGVVFDVGGGSTEIVAGERDQAPEFVQSLDVGTVRLTERYGAVPPVPETIQEAIRADLRAWLSQIPPEVWRLGPLVGTGSTAKVAGRLTEADRMISLEAVRQARTRLAGLTPEAIIALAPEVMTGRADVMVTALLIVEAVMVTARAETFLASPGGLRHGLALQAARR